MFGVLRAVVSRELGHMLGRFTDLYGEGNGDFGKYAIMAFGERINFRPVRRRLTGCRAGWCSYDVPERRGRHRLKVPPIQSQLAVKLVNGPMPWADAIVVEQRVHTNPKARVLPAEGLLVYEAYGRRRVRNVRWDEAKKRPVMIDQRQRFIRADGTKKNEAGDVFREGGLALFGNPSSASSATGCGFWKLDDITLPAESKRKSSKAQPGQFATFNATYCPEHVSTRRGTSPIRLAKRLSPGDYRLYVQASGAGGTVKAEDTLLEVPSTADGQTLWGLVDVRVASDSQRLSVVPEKEGRIEAIQAVPRKPVQLNLLARPVAEQLATKLGGRVTTSTALAKNVCVGGAIEIPLGKSKDANAASVHRWLAGHGADEQIGALLRASLNPDDACRTLVSAANAAGGRDNITALVVDWGQA